MMMSYDPGMAIPSRVRCGALCYTRGFDAMTQTVVPLLAAAWCVVSPFTTAGCARQRPVATIPAAADSAAAHDPVTLRVTNSNWSEVIICLTSAAEWEA